MLTKWDEVILGFLVKNTCRISCVTIHVIFLHFLASSRIPIKTAVTKAEPIQGLKIRNSHSLRKLHLIISPCKSINHKYTVFIIFFFFSVERKPSVPDLGSQSRIPVRSGDNQSPSPVKTQIAVGVSPQNSPTNSQHSTPTKRKLPTPGVVGQKVKEPLQTKSEESKPQSRPWEITNDEDSEVCDLL